MAKTKLQYSIDMSVSHVYNNMSVLDITYAVTKSRIAKTVSILKPYLGEQYITKLSITPCK